MNYLTFSIGSAYRASRDAGRAVVILAKRPGVSHREISLVIRAVFPNHRERKLQYGYCRFGAQPVWINEAAKPFVLPVGMKRDGSDAALERKIVEQLVTWSVEAADQARP